MSTPVTCCLQGWCIEQVKSKVRSIIDQLHDSHKDAAINVVRTMLGLDNACATPCSFMEVSAALMVVLRFFRLLWVTGTLTPRIFQLGSLRYAHAPACNT